MHSVSIKNKTVTFAVQFLWFNVVCSYIYAGGQAWKSRIIRIIMAHIGSTMICDILWLNWARFSSPLAPLIAACHTLTVCLSLRA